MNNIKDQLPLNQLIKKYRIKKGLTQMELSKKAKVSQSLISKIEKSSDKSITFYNLVQLAKILNFGFDEINILAEIREAEQSEMKMVTA